MTFHLTCVHIILVRFGLLSGNLLGKAAHSVDHMFSICTFGYFPLHTFYFYPITTLFKNV